MKRPPSPAFELRHLAALAAVAREGSFRAAADSLGYVQSAVSEQIAALESAIDLRVLERRPGVAPAALTDAGELLLRRYEEIAGSLELVDAELETLRANARRTLRVGVIESVAVELMPDILRELSRLMPDVGVELSWSSSGDELPELVERGRLDAAFTSRPGPLSDSLAIQELMTDPHVLMVPATWPLAATGGPPSAEVLRHVPLIGPQRGERAERVEAELRARGVAPSYVVRAEGNAATQALVAAGIGAAVVPRLAVDAADERVELLPLHGVVAPRAIALCRRPGRPGTQTLAEVAARRCAQPAARPAAATTTEPPALAA